KNSCLAVYTPLGRVNSFLCLQVIGGADSLKKSDGFCQRILLYQMPADQFSSGFHLRSRSGDQSVKSIVQKPWIYLKPGTPGAEHQVMSPLFGPDQRFFR